MEADSAYGDLTIGENINSSTGFITRFGRSETHKSDNFFKSQIFLCACWLSFYFKVCCYFFVEIWHSLRPEGQTQDRQL